jgi:hypothetical protein
VLEFSESRWEPWMLLNKYYFSRICHISAAMLMFYPLIKWEPTEKFN